MDRTDNLGSSATSGQAMDRPIPRRRGRWIRIAWIGAGLITLVVVYLFVRSSTARAVAVADDRLTTARVERGQFDDFIQVRARATPLKTMYVETAQGGQVEAIHVEDGALLTRGQPIVDLANTALQLDLISREAQITEQLNNLRSLELAHAQNRLISRREAIEVDYQITRLTRQVDRLREPVAAGAAPRAELEEARDQLAYHQARRALQKDSDRTADSLRRAQLIQLREAAQQLEENLAVARRNLDSLHVKAPAVGQLTAFTLEIGQSLAPGERIARIDDPDHHKLVADIDEFYLSRVDLDQHADYQVGGKTYRLRVTKIRPQVQNGQFQVDLTFDDEAPAELRRGQTAQVRLQLGQPSEALLVPNATFYNDTGGAWVYVVTSDRNAAVRRAVRLGRRNPQYIEVLDGLAPGEEIVTSSYANYLASERLSLAR